MIHSTVKNEARADNQEIMIMNRRAIILALQVMVGSLVTFGGSAYAFFALNSLGTALGSGHIFIGISGLAVGIVAVSRRVLPRRALLVVNVLTITYSLVSDSAAGFLTLLPTDAFRDSIIGTAAAVALSGAIIYFLRRK